MPTLQYVAEGNTTYTKDPLLGIYQLPDANVVSTPESEVLFMF